MGEIRGLIRANQLPFPVIIKEIHAPAQDGFRAHAPFCRPVVIINHLAGALTLGGIRAGLAINAQHVKLARKDDDINVLALAADFFNMVHARLIVEEFLKTPYSNLPRHQRRIDKINELEHSDIPEV